MVVDAVASISAVSVVFICASGCLLGNALFEQSLQVRQTHISYVLIVFGLCACAQTPVWAIISHMESVVVSLLVGLAGLSAPSPPRGCGARAVPAGVRRARFVLPWPGLGRRPEVIAAFSRLLACNESVWQASA